MKYLFILLFVATSINVFAQRGLTVSSPDKNIRFWLSADQSGLVYKVSYKGNMLVEQSRLSISFEEGGAFSNHLKLEKHQLQHLEENYNLIVGKNSKVHSECNQLLVSVSEKSGLKRQLQVEVKVFNDGAAFRYRIPQQQQWKSVNITDEANTFNLSQNPIVLTLFRENYTTSHEGIYSKLHLSEIKADTLMDLPTMFSFPKGIFMAITEANLRDYGGMYLVKHQGVLQSSISPLPNQMAIKVKAKLPHQSPWRVMMIGNRMGTLIESNLLTNLSDPSQIKDVSWIKPGKTTFPWWNGNVVPDTSFAPGNNYETNMYYVNFCAKNSIAYHTVVEYGLHEWYVNDGANFSPGPHADPSKAVPGLDMQQLCDSAKKVGVGIRVWVHFAALYPKLEATFAQYEKWGIKGLMCDFMDRDDQEMVNMQEEILQKAAQHHLHIQFHGAYKPTGLNRTYPNEFTREGTLNYENNKWNNIVTPNADINIPFTRGLAGSTDYHLGGFRAANPSTFKVHYTAPMVPGTRCHMLAMYVVLENEQGMVCDYPDAYIGQPGFEFIKEVPITWDETKAVNAKLSEYITIARRKGSDWYLGTINSNTPRNLNTPLSFLPKGNYTAEIYSDAPDANINPNHLVKVVQKVSNQTVLKTILTAGGGQVVRLRKDF
ncbi:glycoside hydrolase family 97 protein [uncultured Mucilaginibacter sp.]|uniref:glycoside hydrolase family 97 protein n=1 Tax=uncultured Mucilaginibacter sp. TaxID=797541 RepID=UPI00262D057C|nr:glycoside hydrolase family 97 protein [uncultured Mucilaginibacter sp.]